MSNKNRQYRREQMRIFNEHMKGIDQSMPYVIGGDFNTLATHPIIRLLRKSFSLRTGTPLHPTWMFNGKNKHIIRSNIDYIGVPFLSSLRFKAFTVLMNRSPSDHAPLIGTFELGDSPLDRAKNDRRMQKL
jgi:endonuclease/exonuclease/phosphatase (EEP) superfamily protein YafD